MNIHYLLCTPIPLEEAGGIRERKESWWIEHLLRQELDGFADSGAISSYSMLPSSVLGFPLKEPYPEKDKRIYRVDRLVADLDEVLREYEAIKAKTSLPKKLDDKRFSAGFGIRVSNGSKKSFEEAVNEKKVLYQQAAVFFGTGDVSQWARELDALEQPDPGFDAPNPMGIKNNFSYLAYTALVHEFGYLMARIVPADRKELPGLSQNLAERCIVKVVDV